MKVLTEPNKILRQKSKKVTKAELKDNKKLISDMVDTMFEQDGVGLAAPQVGVLKRIIIVSTKDGPLPLINPMIVSKSWSKDVEEEGCLSVLQTSGDVKRHKRINVKAYDVDGKQIKLKAKGLFARIIQHEIDHLDGILFIDKAKNVKRY